MCRNYNEGKCIVNDKNCKFGEDGKDLAQGKCDLHGEYDVWRIKDRILVSNTGKEPEGNKGALGYGLDFLVADELAFKKSKRLNLPTDYVSKE